MNLDKLYIKQEKLDNHILENARKRNVVMSKEEWLDKTILALLVEVGELANATRCFKHWSTKGAESKERLLDELADVWHFYLSIGNQMGMKLTIYMARYYASNEGSALTEIDALTYNFHLIYIDASEIANNSLRNSADLTSEYNRLGGIMIRLAKTLGFTDEEVEQAYLKKHEENYRRQAEGY